MLATDRLRIENGVSYQLLGNQEDGVLLSMASGYLYRCNPTAVEILNSVQNQPTYAELLTQFSSRYGLEETHAQADLSRFVAELIAEKLIAKAA